MGKSFLQKLYGGEIFPFETVNCMTLEHKELNHKIMEEKIHLKSILSDEEWRRYEDLENLQAEHTSAYGYENFAYGFRLGAALMIESFVLNKD